jgi:hypothetical protein
VNQLNKNSWIFIGLILVVLIAGSSIILNQYNNSVTINIETNGTEISVEASTSLPFNDVPEDMEQEILNYLVDAIKSPDSTLESIESDVKLISKKFDYNDVNVNLKSQFGENQLPMPAVVSGNSMYPTLKDGQNLIILKTKNFKVGDIVISKHNEYDLIVKRVGKIESNRIYLMSDNKEVETIYEGNYIITKTPLNTWVPRNYVIGIVKDY